MSLSVVKQLPRACDFADVSVKPIAKYLEHLRLRERDSSKITQITQKLIEVEKLGCRLEKLVEEVKDFIAEAHDTKNYNAFFFAL
jgi:hypothetical protein